VANVLRLVASALSRRRERMGDSMRPVQGLAGQSRRHHRRRPQAGPDLWTPIATGQPYDETKAFDHRPSTLASRLKNLQPQAQPLKMNLVPA
jgi:hypothetical protein